jgi:hypothetical protein
MPGIACHTMRRVLTLWAPAVLSAATSTVVVSPGRTPGESGANLVKAVAGFKTGESQPRQIKLPPGLYDIGREILLLPPSLDIEGSGESVTIIRGQLPLVIGNRIGVRILGEIRRLTVQGGNMPGGTTIGFRDCSWKLSDVTVMPAAIEPARSAPRAISAAGGTGVLTRVTIPRGKPSSEAVWLKGGTYTIRESDISVGTEGAGPFVALHLDSATVFIGNSAISTPARGPNTAIQCDACVATVNSSRISGPTALAFHGESDRGLLEVNGSYVYGAAKIDRNANGMKCHGSFGSKGALNAACQQ